MDITFSRLSGLRGEVNVPGDKSISHRFALLSALADGRSRATNFLKAKDCLGTLGCVRSLGIEASLDGSSLVIEGKGIDGLSEPTDVLDAGNSGTTMRLMLGILASNDMFSVITGDESLRSRPMKRVVTPLGLMGAEIWGRGGGDMAPLAVRGGELHGINYRPDVSSAQVKSSILLAGLRATGTTTVEERVPTRDHTEKMLGIMGANIRSAVNRISLTSSRLRSIDIDIPGDFSSASFMIALGTLVEDSEVLIPGCGLNASRTGFLDILDEMGGSVGVVLHPSDWEQSGDVTVTPSGLRGIEIGADRVVHAIDEIPIVALLATQAEGRTIISGASELRKKESDRLHVLSKGLGAMGASIEKTEDGLLIDGPTRLRGAELDPEKDHRMALTFAVAGCIADGDTTVKGWECSEVSYPGFRAQLDHLAGNG